jgi:hypothetical protein
VASSALTFGNLGTGRTYFLIVSRWARLACVIVMGTPQLAATRQRSICSAPSFSPRKTCRCRYTTFNLVELRERAYYPVIPSGGRWLAIESPNIGPVSHRELRRLAIKLREDLINSEEKLGETREFAELVDTAGALIIAITEPEQYRASTRESEKLLEFPSNQRRQTAS